jgi:hypothetical protein
VAPGRGAMQLIVGAPEMPAQIGWPFSGFVRLEDAEVSVYRVWP